MYSYAFGIIFNILELCLLIIGLYYLAGAFFSFFTLRKTPQEPDLKRFAVVIPAHNEAMVLPALLRSIADAAYPKEYIHTFVIADGCTDNTAAVALSFGAEIISKPSASCKGDALRYAFGIITERDFDCIAVLDADNTVDKGFFSEMNEELNLGYSAIQGYIDSKNPDASWVANAYSIWYWITNRIIQKGRSNLGLGCRLGGTGFVICRKALLDVP